MTNSFAIVPAAGLSLRMGQHKLLMPWGDSTVIEQVLTAWTSSRVDRVVVVVRRDDAALIKACRMFSVDMVAMHPPPLEMKASVRYGLEFIRQAASPGEKDVWLLAPADMPRLCVETIDRLLDSHKPQHPTILVPRYENRRGHPVLFPWSAAVDVSTLAADEGVNALLKRHRVRYVETRDAAIHDDLDTPEDYQRLNS